MDIKHIPLNQPIAQGRTADVYAWDNTHILKLFHNWFELGDIEYELRVARAVHASGVKSPLVKELIQVDGRNGLIYERIRGETMLRMYQRKPWKVQMYARVLAQLHVQMHERAFDEDIPEQRERLHRKIQYAIALPSSLKSLLINSLDSMPFGNRVCHGDLHPDNVLISDGNALVIDWIDASRGNPLADVARTSIILLGAANSSQTENILEKFFVKYFHTEYLHEYFRLHPQGMGEYRRWLPIVAGARLNEGIPELEKWLVEQAGKV